MLRSTRTIASLIHHLMLGTATVVATGTLLTTVVGCKDEGKPDYWVDKLEDRAWRPRAVKRLEQFFEDALTKANKDASAPEVKALLDKIADPLTKSYVQNYDDFDTKTRVSLIKLLSAFRDPRTVPALKKAFEEFVKRPATNKDDADIKWAARGAGALKDPSLAEPMIQTFMKLKASTMLGGVTYKDFNDALQDMPQPSWAGPLRSMLDAPIAIPKSAADKDKLDPYKDQLFWQTTSALLLGMLKDQAAVEPLMKVMLDPVKADVQATALLALVKIGRPAVTEAVKLLRGENAKLKDFALIKAKEASGSDKMPEDEPYVRTAALIIGTIGRPEGLAPMIEAVKTAKGDVNKAVIAREIAKIPATADSKAAFKTAFESISLDTTIPPGANALQLLVESSGVFYDPTMIPWLLERAEKTAGTGDDKTALQSAILVTVLKLAKADQLDSVRPAVGKYGTKMEKDFLAIAEKQLKACGDRVQCYLAEVEKGDNQDQANQFAGIKACYMSGIHGTEQTRMDLIERLGSVDNAAVRYSVAQAIDFLSPKGSKEAAKKLETIITANEKTGDRNKIANDSPLKQVMYRIESRAE
jgi:HEAT repeat protein